MELLNSNTLEEIVGNKIESVALDYAKAASDLNDIEHDAANLKRVKADCERVVLENAENSSDWDAIALYITDHGFTQIIERFEHAIREDYEAYNDIYNRDVKKSIITPSNFKSFILTAIAKAFSEKSYTFEEGRGSGMSEQYRYNFKLKRWSNDKQSLEFVVIVKVNKIITGYFNWVSTDDG